MENSTKLNKAQIGLKSFTLTAVIFILIIGFSACERMPHIVQPTTPQVENQATEISIGVALPLTGTLSPTGKLMKQGFALALDEINNTEGRHHRFTFIIEDDMGTPEGATRAFNKLIHEDGVSVILGPSTSSATQAAFPIAQENQIVAISPTSSARGLSAIGDFVFRVPIATDTIILKSNEALQAKLGYQQVATMYDDTDFFSIDLDMAWRETFAAQGIEVITTETFQSGDTDFLAQLTRIKTLKPDAVFVSALPPEKPGILIQRKNLDIAVPFFVSSLTNLEIQTAGPAAEGAITIGSWLSTDNTPGNQAFVQNYSETYGTVPNAFAMASYTAAHILAEAIANAQSTDAVAVRDALANLRDFDTVMGTFSFDANGDGHVTDIPNLVLTVKEGRLQTFE